MYLCQIILSNYDKFIELDFFASNISIERRVCAFSPLVAFDWRYLEKFSVYVNFLRGFFGCVTNVSVGLNFLPAYKTVGNQ